MSYYGQTCVFGNLTLTIQVIRARKLPSTKKQWVNGRLNEIAIPHRDLQDWELTIEGTFASSTEATRDAQRTTLEGYADGDKVALVDGAHDGEYVIRPETLVFDDNRRSNPAEHKYMFTIVQDQG